MEGGMEDGMGWSTGGEGKEWDMMDGIGRGLHGPAQCCLLLNTLPSHNLEMKHLPGADPELVLLSHRYEELEVSGQCGTQRRSRVWGGWCPTGAGCNLCLPAENPPE